MSTEIPPTKKIINHPNAAVDDALQGLLLTNPHLKLLESCHRVVVRSDVNEQATSGKVALIAGGGSGHEPVFAGYVGAGLLTAAVAGHVFASPPATHILHAIRAVANKAEFARIIFINREALADSVGGISLGSIIALRGNGPIRVIVCGDDTAVMQPNKSTGRRGLAGSLMLLKMAGAWSEAGKSINEIVESIEQAKTDCGTIGLSLGSCSLPGQPPIFHLEPTEIGLGLGVHGEPGVMKIAHCEAAKIVDKMLTHMNQAANPFSLKLTKGSDVVILINNLGGVSQLEMGVIIKEVLNWFAKHSIAIHRLYAGLYMTSLEMHGFSISALKLQADNKQHRLQALDAPALCVGWPMRPVPPLIQSTVLPELQDKDNQSNVDAESSLAKVSDATASVIRDCLLAACKALQQNETLLNQLDQAAGDGDCGTTMTTGTAAIQQAITNEQLNFHCPSQLLQQISIIWEANTGGTSGAIYGLLLSGASKALASATSPNNWVLALNEGSNAIRTYGKADPGDRTLMDALCAINEVFANNTELNKTTLELAVQKMTAAVTDTAQMKTACGRASYVHVDNLTQPDAGAMAVQCWFNAVVDVLLR